ncbi:repetitive organellar protein-like [Adelges cooleyi]|uniref:repetitive organellar protein-like n=1 Tax=Adelges cooleyi TaxID=133065 RepID=UPI00217F767F|nr:repetitive organellar protein-like [Adelges cooleyi]
MYQNTARDLDRRKSEITGTNAELIALNEKNMKLNNRAKHLIKQNEHLEEKMLFLENRLCEELNNIDKLKCKIESQKACLEQKSEENNRNKQTAEEQREQLINIQSDLRILNSKLDLERENYVQLKNETAMMKKKIVKEKETLESQIETMEKEKVEMEHVFLGQNYKIQQLNKKTLDLKQLKDELKCTLENERSRADEHVENLQKDKCCLEAKVEALSCQMDVCTKESGRLKCENDKMNKAVRDLQNTLEATNKRNEAKRLAADEEVQSIFNEKHKLQFKLDSTVRKICRLEEDLTNTRQLCTDETENVCELKRTIADLQFSQKLMSNSMNACPNKNIGNQLADFCKVLDTITGDCKTLDDCSKGKPRNLEQLVKELGTISDSLTRSPPC